MPLPDNFTYKLAHAVIWFEDPLRRDPATTEALVAALGTAFPIPGPRQQMPPEAPLQIPHVIVQSTSTQVAISSTQADIEVRFYGDYPASTDLVYGYIARKTAALLAGLDAVGATSVMAGLVVTAGFSFQTVDRHEPIRHVLGRHLRADLETDSTNDARIGVGLRVADHFFVNMSIESYEARQVQRPFMPGMQAVVVRPWEGDVTDCGVDLSVDINNRLRAISQRAYQELNQAELTGLIELSRLTVERYGLDYVLNAAVNVPDLAAAAVH